ncbi:MAG: N-acetylneuraminate synthase family protein [bacterium]
MNRIKVGNIMIGGDDPCFIIVDIGANHNKSLRTAKKLIDKAAEAGANAVKFQIYSAEKLYSKNVPRHSYYKKDLWRMIKDIELPRKWIPELKAYCNKKNVTFFATPFDAEAVDELAPYVDLYKIASFELVDIPLIKFIAKKKKPIIISTGLAKMQEIKDAYSTCINAGNKKVIFLQCASAYPAKAEIMNLSAMKNISGSLGVISGLSDHTLGIHISVAAVAMGAKVIEKHFTLDKKMEGPDHPFAVEPKELKALVSQIREVEAAIGSGKKLGPRACEMENYQIGRRSIHAKTEIPKGTIIKDEMLIVKRPSFGIQPKYFDKVVGKKTKRSIKADEWITWKSI